jgi:hypothetical protein
MWNIGTQFEPTWRIRQQLPTPPIQADGGEAMAVAISGDPWSGTSGGLATSNYTQTGGIAFTSQGGVVGQPVDMNSISVVPAVSPSGARNPASTTFNVGTTLGNLVNTVVQDLTGLVPWVIIALVLWFVYKHFFKHGR